MSQASALEREMLDLINAERTSRGLDPVQLEVQLNASAEDHSEWMLDTNTFSHTGVGNSSATQRIQDAGFDLEGSWRTAENIAWQSQRGEAGFSDDVVDLHKALMSSAGHRANILNSDLTYIGIGIEIGKLNGIPAVMVTQNFAHTTAPVQLDMGGAPFGGDAVVGATHFIETGYSEGRTVTFNGLEYIASYGDLMSAFGADAGAGAAHYTTAGVDEGRTVTFNGLEYIASYGDLMSAFGPDAVAGSFHFIDFGSAEGRTTTFDGHQYIASHEDLILAFGSDRDLGSAHYISHGVGEGRATDTFDADQYLANYADLQASFGDDTDAATVHYIDYGFFEGRVDDVLFV